MLRKQKVNSDDLYTDDFLKNNKLYCFLNFILFAGFVFIIAFMQKYNTLWDDDWFFAAYRINENMFSALDFNSTHGGGVFGTFYFKIILFYNSGCS